MARVIINQDICKGCGLCVRACPQKILILDMNTININGYNPSVCTDMDKCTGCTMCARTCPDVCIEVER